MKRLSIIVPMYNVEPYVERCLRSLEDQDIPRDEYEIICINDGSPDNSQQVVTSLQKEYDNIILINQKNQGVSLARNKGIDYAYGNYLLFVDPDDYVDPDTFSRALNNAESSDTQVSFLGFTSLDKNGTVIYQSFNLQNIKKNYNGHEAYFISRGSGQIDPDRMWAILFKREFLNLNNLRYLQDVPYLEDGEFIARILCLTERCNFDGNSFYQRTTRPGSATHSKLYNTERATTGFLLAAKNLKSFQEDQNLNESQRQFLNQPICKFTVLVVDSARKPFGLKKIFDIKTKLNESGLSKVRLDSVNDEFTKLGNCYNRSIFHLIIYQNILYIKRFIYLRVSNILAKYKHKGQSTINLS
jgi:glycosyltransferase involved in cell wall biosynthesis